MESRSESSKQVDAAVVQPPQTLAKTDLPFSGPQIMVLHGVRDGKNITKAAKLAGVHRTTVHAWRQENPDYEAAFQEWKRQGRENSRAGVVSLSDLALRTVKKDMLKGGVKTAIKVLDSLGAFDRDKETPTTGAEISEERVLDAEQKKIRQDERREKLAERYLKAAVARSQRQKAIAAAMAKAKSRPNALPGADPDDITEEEEEEIKEQYMEAVRKAALGQDPDDEEEDEESATPVAEAAKPIIPNDAGDDSIEPDDDQDEEPGPNGLDARSA